MSLGLAKNIFTPAAHPLFSHSFAPIPPLSNKSEIASGEAWEVSYFLRLLARSQCSSSVLMLVVQAPFYDETDKTKIHFSDVAFALSYVFYVFSTQQIPKIPKPEF